VAEAFDWVHTVDRLKIAQRLAEQRPAWLPPLQLCLQVNISGEASKSGVRRPSAGAGAPPWPRCRGAGAARADGHSRAGRQTSSASVRRTALRELLDALRAQGLALDTLSMGMSADLEAAVTEGATLVRVGSAIFGAGRGTRPGRLGGQRLRRLGGGPGGRQGSSHAARRPVAVVSLVENQHGYVGIGRGGLPESPLPLVRVLMQQSGCFRIVDRHAGLEATVREQELKDQGVLRNDGSVAKGRGIMAQYSVVPSLTFSEQDAGARSAASWRMIPFLNQLAGAAEQVKLKEAQVVLLLTDNETTEQLSSATGAARTTDLGLGGLVVGKPAAPGAWAGATPTRPRSSRPPSSTRTTTWWSRCAVLAAKPLPEPVRKTEGEVIATRAAADSAAQIGSCALFFTSSITA
jgi:hypothetical protein